LNAPPRKKASAKRKPTKTKPLAGLETAKQTWGLKTLYSANAVELKQSLAFTGKTVSVVLGSKATGVPLTLTPQWCSHAKKERWQVCALINVGRHTLWLGNKPATIKVAWQKPKNNQYQALQVNPSGLQVVE
jgi:hypothetical protein